MESHVTPDDVTIPVSTDCHASYGSRSFARFLRATPLMPPKIPVCAYRHESTRPDKHRESTPKTVAQFARMAVFREPQSRHPENVIINRLPPLGPKPHRDQCEDHNHRDDRKQGCARRGWGGLKFIGLLHLLSFYVVVGRIHFL